MKSGKNFLGFWTGLCGGVFLMGYAAGMTPAVAQETVAQEPASSQAQVYTIDKAHTSFDFAVKHLMVSTTRGDFTDFSGTIVYDPQDFSRFQADVTIKVDSIDTQNSMRDDHLRGAEFFDSEKYPLITFKAKELKQGDQGPVLTGDLTIKDVTKSVDLPLTIAGPIQGPQGDEVMGLSTHLRINRQDFHISWNKTLDTGGLMVDDWVDITVDIEAHAKKS